MAYMLQPHLERLEQPAVPRENATDFIFSYPQPTTLNGITEGRANTMLFGTAPFMAGKGAPNDLVEFEDTLRPQTTKGFNKSYVPTYEKRMHPLQNMDCSQPLRVWDEKPGSTRAQVQNCLFQQRYLS
jgi:hypothetical protein